jgi:hypothetical protein
VLDIKVDVRGAALPLCFTIRGRVTGLAPLEDGRERLEAQLVECDRRFFDALQSLFKKRQEEIDLFLSGMRR